ncbi:hypothetical protein L208DRAFT_1127011, partial [Tricholoma matsutake]
WYAHKVSYPWLLPGFNKTLSRMPNDCWDTTPHHTNLVETAHAGTNRQTQINLLPIEAIQQARTLDAHVASSIMAVSNACILPNINNSEILQLSCTISHRNHSTHQHYTHKAIDNNINEVCDCITTTTQMQKDLKAQLKEL